MKNLVHKTININEESNYEKIFQFGVFHISSCSATVCICCSFSYYTATHHFLGDELIYAELSMELVVICKCRMQLRILPLKQHRNASKGIAFQGGCHPRTVQDLIPCPTTLQSSKLSTPPRRRGPARPVSTGLGSICGPMLAPC